MSFFSMEQASSSRRSIRFCIVILPLVFSVPWPTVLYLFCLVSLYASSSSLVRLEHPVATRLFAVFGPFFLVVLYCVFQLTPLPPSWLQNISPGTWRAYGETIWVLQPGTWMPISIDFEKTLLAGLFVASIGGLCLAINQIAQKSRHLQELLHAIAFSVSVWALIAIIAALLLITRPFGGITHGSWISLLHAECLFWAVGFFPIVLAGYSAQRSRVRQHPLSVQIKAYLKAPVDYLHVIQFFAVVLVLFSLLVALSPVYAVGALSGWLLLIAFRQALANNRNGKKLCLLSTCALVSIAGLIFLGRMLNIYAWGFQQNTDAAASVLPRWQFTWLGCGLGAQHDLLIRQVGPVEVTEKYNGLSGLHSLWLGLGSCGTLLVMLTCLALIVYGYRYRSVNTDRMTKRIYAGGLSSLVLISSLAATDMQVGWEPVTAAAFLAIAIAAGARASHHWTHEYHAEARADGRWASRSIAAAMIIVLAIGSLYLGASSWATFRQGQLKMSVIPGHEVDMGKALAERAATVNRWAPFNTSLKMALGYKFLSLGLESEAFKIFAEALSLRPLSAEALVATVVTAAGLGHDEQSLQILKSKAIERYRGGRHLEELVARALKVPQSVVTEEFLDRAFASDPGNSSRYLNLMLLAGYDLHDLRNHLLLRSETIMAYGDLLLAAGEVDAAETAYIEAVSLNSEERSSVTTFIRVAEYFAASGKDSQALVVARTGLDVFPGNAKLHQMVAELSARD